MKISTLILLGLVLTACGDDAGLAESSTGSTSASGSTAGTEGVDGGSTTEAADTTEGDEPPDPTPILEREPMLTHACEETRRMDTLAPNAFGRADALVTVGGEYFVLRSGTTLSLTNVALDGTLGHEVLLEQDSFRNATAVAVDASIVVLWTYASSTLRYAAFDDALGTVVAPRDVAGISGDYVAAAAIVPAPAGGLASIYAESDEAGETMLRFVLLDANGEAVGSPVDIGPVGEAYATFPASAAVTSDGGYAVSYVVGELSGDTEVLFVVLDADGTPRFAPQRISQQAGDGWTSRFGTAPRRSLLPVGDAFWVVFTEERSDSRGTVLNSVVRLAIVDAEGESETHVLQAPVDGTNNLWPSFVEFEDRVGLMWTSGTIPGVCVGCVSDNDLHFVLLDPNAVVPASNVAIQLNPMNGITGPLGAFVGADMLTVASLDFHAATLPASGALRCEATRAGGS